MPEKKQLSADVRANLILAQLDVHLFAETGKPVVLTMHRPILHDAIVALIERGHPMPIGYLSIAEDALRAQERPQPLPKTDESSDYFTTVMNTPLDKLFENEVQK